MPGSGANKRFSRTFGTVNGEQVKVAIIDTSYSGSANEFTIDMDAGGLELAYNTNDQDIYQRVDTMTATLSIINDSTETEELFADLLEAEEDRFYLEIKNGSDQLQFLGKIVADDMTQQDRKDPPLKIVAICSTTDLKNIDFDAPYDAYTPMTISEVLLYCLNKLSSNTSLIVIGV